MVPSIDILSLQVDLNLLQVRNIMDYISCLFDPVDPSTMSCTW